MKYAILAAALMLTASAAPAQDRPQSALKRMQQESPGNPMLAHPLFGGMMINTMRDLDATCKDMTIGEQRQFGIHHQCVENRRQLEEAGKAR